MVDGGNSMATIKQKVDAFYASGLLTSYWHEWLLDELDDIVSVRKARGIDAVRVELDWMDEPSYIYRGRKIEIDEAIPSGYGGRYYAGRRGPDGVTLAEVVRKIDRRLDG